MNENDFGRRNNIGMRNLNAVVPKSLRCLSSGPRRQLLNLS